MIGNIVRPNGSSTPTVIKTTTSVSSSAKGDLSMVKKNDLIIIVSYSSTAPTFTSLSTTLLASGYARSSTYGTGRTYIANEDGTSASKFTNGSSYTCQYYVIRP